MHSERGAANAPFFVGKFVVIATPQSALPPACPERGGGCECNEQTEGLHRGFCCLRQPLSQTFGLPSPSTGRLLGAVQAPTQKLSPLAGDSSRARPVGDAARGESGGIGSIASGSAARRPYSNQRSCRGASRDERGMAKLSQFISPTSSSLA